MNPSLTNRHEKASLRANIQGNRYKRITATCLFQGGPLRRRPSGKLETQESAGGNHMGTVKSTMERGASKAKLVGRWDVPAYRFPGADAGLPVGGASGVKPPGVSRAETSDRVLKLLQELKSGSLNPVARAYAVREVMSTAGLTKTEAAARIGVPRTTLTDWLDVLDIDEKYQAALVGNWSGGNSPLTVSHVAEAIGLAAKLRTPAIGKALLDAVMQFGLSRTDTRRVATVLRGNPASSVSDAVERVRCSGAGESPNPGSLQGRRPEGAGSLSKMVAEIERLQQRLERRLTGALWRSLPDERGRLRHSLTSLRGAVETAVAMVQADAAPRN